MPASVQAAIAIVGFFAAALAVAALLRLRGAAVLTASVLGLLALSLVLAAVTDSAVFAVAALVLALLAAVLRFAFDAAVWREHRGR
jgi:hypothetical protein